MKPTIISIKKIGLLFSIVILLFSCQSEKKDLSNQDQKEPIESTPARFVKGNTLISKELPEIQIKVDEEFNFIGKFYFEIIASSEEYAPEMRGKPIAAGDRYVFVSADENQVVNKLFIVQLEGFLKENDLIFNYNFDKSDFIGENKYRHNTWFYDSKMLAKENPNNEGAKTRRFLQEKGFVLEDQFMMSRFVGLASEDRKNEIIIFYIEMLKKTTGYSLEKYKNSVNKEEAQLIQDDFVERSKNSFDIIKG